MNDMLNILKQRLAQSKAEYEELLKQLEPLYRKKNLLEDRVKTIEHLISLEQGVDETIGGKSIKTDTDEIKLGELANKKPIVAYEELIKNYFKKKPFREDNVRNLAIAKGLRIKGKTITSSYSRTVLLELTQMGILERVERGVYRLKTEQGERNKEGILF